VGLDMEVNFKKVELVEGMIFAINIFKGLAMFLFAVLDSMGFLEQDFGLGLDVKIENGVLFGLDEVVHAREDVLDLIVDSAIDLAGASVLEPVDFPFEQEQFYE
jgi:hypothetical protein